MKTFGVNVLYLTVTVTESHQDNTCILIKKSSPPVPAHKSQMVINKQGFEVTQNATALVQGQPIIASKLLITVNCVYNAD